VRWPWVLAWGMLVAAVVLVARLSPAPVLVAGVVVVIGSAFLVHHVAGLDPRRLTTSGVWYVSYIVGTVVPAFFVAADKHTRYVGPYLFAVLSALITLPAGMALVNVATRLSKREVQAFFAAPVDPGERGPQVVGAFGLILAVCLALSAGYLIETPVVPLLYLIRSPGGAAELVLLREESFKLLDSPFLYAYDVLRRVIYPFVIAVALGHWLVTRRRIWLVLFAVTAVVGLVYAALTIAKMPVAVIALVAVLFLYLYSGGRVRARTVFFGIAGVFLFPVFVLAQSLSGLGVSPWLIARGILHRLFYLPAEILYYYFEVVPDVLPYLHGRTIGRLNWVLGDPEFDIAAYVFQYMFPGGLESGSAPAPFLGYLHADFGVVGVLAGGVLVGMLTQGLQVVLTRRPKTVVTLAAYAYMLWAAWRINTGSITQALLSGGIVVIFAMMGLIRLLQEILRVSTSRPARWLAEE